MSASPGLHIEIVTLHRNKRRAAGHSVSPAAHLGSGTEGQVISGRTRPLLSRYWTASLLCGPIPWRASLPSAVSSPLPRCHLASPPMMKRSIKAAEPVSTLPCLPHHFGLFISLDFFSFSYSYRARRLWRRVAHRCRSCCWQMLGTGRLRPIFFRSCRS